MYNFVSLQVDYWDNPWQNRHSFIWELSKQYRVLFLSPPFYLVDILRDFGSSKTKLKGINKLNPNLISYIPSKLLPYQYRLKGLDLLFNQIRNSLLQKYLKKENFTDPILLIWHPDFCNYINEINYSKIIYYKYDNYAGYFGGSGRMSNNEKNLFKKADIVFVSSHGLMEMHKYDHENIFLLPNGVDYNFFNRSIRENNLLPSDIDSIPRPRIGYVGVINEKVDFKLLDFICKNKPDWSIVLVGPVKVREKDYLKDLEALKRNKNCYFLGQKSHSEVPLYINALDICMMCYIVNDWTYYGYPLKMHEYLAVGKPIVSVNLPAVVEFDNVISIPKTPEEWIFNINELFSTDTSNLILKRKKVAKENSWEERVKKFQQIIDL